jgi:hypothetical protein
LVTSRLDAQYLPIFLRTEQLILGLFN